MEILFVIDSIEDLNRKISLLEATGADIKFFVNAKYVTKVMQNKNILTNIQAIYNNNINETIDNYLKDDKYQAQSALLYHSSVKLTKEILDYVRELIAFNPSTVYVKKRFSFWTKIKLWFYQKLVKLLFDFEDAYASTKFQYFSKEIMQVFSETNFKNHVFAIPNSLSLEISDKDKKTYYNKPKFNRFQLYNPIVLCIILICYVVIEKFLTLPFWTYFLIVALILATIINWIIMIIKDDFDIRYKK